VHRLQRLRVALWPPCGPGVTALGPHQEGDGGAWSAHRGRGGTHHGDERRSRTRHPARAPARLRRCWLASIRRDRDGGRPDDTAQKTQWAARSGLRVALELRRTRVPSGRWRASPPALHRRPRCRVLFHAVEGVRIPRGHLRIRMPEHDMHPPEVGTALEAQRRGRVPQGVCPASHTGKAEVRHPESCCTCFLVSPRAATAD